MKRLIQQGAFLFRVLGVDRDCAGTWLHVRMQDRRAHILEDWPDMHSLEADLVFLGNSRTAEHLIPTVACEGLNQSCYNLAYDGYSVQMGAYRLDYLLRNGKRKPKFVALQVDLSFCLGDGTGEKLSNERRGSEVFSSGPDRHQQVLSQLRQLERMGCLCPVVEVQGISSHVLQAPVGMESMGPSK